MQHAIVREVISGKSRTHLSIASWAYNIETRTLTMEMHTFAGYPICPQVATSDNVSEYEGDVNRSDIWYLHRDLEMKWCDSLMKNHDRPQREDKPHTKEQAA